MHHRENQQIDLREVQLKAALFIILPGAMCATLTAATIFLLPSSLEDYNCGSRDFSLRGKIGGITSILIYLTILITMGERNYFNKASEWIAQSTMKLFKPQNKHNDKMEDLFEHFDRKNTYSGGYF